MAEVSKERMAVLLRAACEVVASSPEGLQAAEVLRRVKDAVALTDYERGQYASGAQRYTIILRFQSIAAVKAGWLIKAKGKWTITDAGRAALRAHPDSTAFFAEAGRLYQQWKHAQVTVDHTDGESDEVADDADATVTFEQAEEQAWAEISGYLQRMLPYDFQELVASLLRAMGYHVSWVSPPGKDGGIDILAATDPLGTKPPRIKVQVKRYNANIAVDSLRAFMALLGEQDVGLFVTTSSFTKDAWDEARAQERRRITLIDLERLVDLWIEHYGKLDEGSKRRLPLRPIYFLAPEV